EEVMPAPTWICVGMFWLTAILGVVVAGIAALVFYQQVVFASQYGSSLPAYIVAANGLMVVCATGLFYSAWLWKSRRMRGGLITFLAVAVGFFGGPPLLLMLLAR
ncbi:MAG: hypothetical protein WBD31_27185, partial [Rubripirellula sp.]